MKKELLLRGGRIIDPANKIDTLTDLLIQDGKIAKIGKVVISKNLKVINVKGLVVIPGIIDMHTHLREPGHEEEETIATGTRAAAMGGVTTVCCMPNTHPVLDNQTTVEFILLKAKKEGLINVRPIGAVTQGSLGEQIAEIGELYKTGVVAISDDGNSIMNSQVMRRALEYAKMFDLPVIVHCEDINLSAGGVINQGKVATLLGLKGIPSEAEEIIVARDIILTEMTGGRLHIAHVSSAGTVELIRSAKKRRVNVTAEVTPHHFTLTEKATVNYEPNTKVNPPLRTEEDITCIKEGLRDGTIDCIVTDHAPHTEEEKNKEYDLAPFGIIGLETMLGLVITELVVKQVLTLPEAIAKLTCNPAKILNIPAGTLTPGSTADVTVFDINRSYTVGSTFTSKSSNSPFIGYKLKGKPIMTIVAGKVVMENGNLLVF